MIPNREPRNATEKWIPPARSNDMIRDPSLSGPIPPPNPSIEESVFEQDGWVGIGPTYPIQ